MACRVLVPWSVIEPKHTALQVGSLNPRTTREVPRSLTQRQEDGLSAGQVPPRSGVQWLYRLAYCSLSSIFLTGVRQGNNAVLRGLLWELSVWQSNHEFFFTSLSSVKQSYAFLLCVPPGAVPLTEDINVSDRRLTNQLVQQRAERSVFFAQSSTFS